MDNLNFDFSRNQSLSQSIDGLVLNSSSGRPISFDSYKRQSLRLSRLMAIAVPYKSLWFNMAHCGDFMIVGKTSLGEKRILNANFCHARLCPMCQQRRSAKARAQVFEIIKHYDDDVRFLFLTLTLKNVICSAEAISSTFKLISSAWQRLSQRSVFRDVVHGYYKSIEMNVDLNMKITSDMYERASEYYKARNISIGDDNPNFFNVHPHLHVILAVNNSYFVRPGRSYTSQKKWVELWRDALRADYDPILDIRKITDLHGGSDTTSAVLEVTKYATKPSDILFNDASDEIRICALREIYEGISGKRFTSFGGSMRHLHKLCNLSDIEDDSDLDDFDIPDEKVVDIEGYNWDYGVSGGRYVRNALTEKMYKQLVKDRGY